MEEKKQLDFFPKPVEEDAVEETKASAKKKSAKKAAKAGKKPAKRRPSKKKANELKTLANPPHGTKGDFVKVTVTLPPDIYQQIMQEATRRKMAKEDNPLLSAIIREAVVEYLDK